MLDSELTDLSIGNVTFTLQKKSGTMDGYSLKGFTAKRGETLVTLTDMAHDSSTAGKYYTYSLDTANSSLIAALFDYDTLDGGTIVLTANDFDALLFKVTIYLQDNLQVMNAKSTDGGIVPSASYTAVSSTAYTGYPKAVTFDVSANETKIVYVNGTSFAYYASATENAVGSISASQDSTDKTYWVITITKPTEEASICVRETAKRYKFALDDSTMIQTTAVGGNADVGTTKTILASNVTGTNTYTGGTKTLSLSETNNDTMEQVTLKGFTATVGSTTLINTTSMSGSFSEATYASSLFDYHSIDGNTVTIKANTFESVKYNVSLTMTGLWFNGATYKNASNADVSAINQTTPEMNVTNTATAPTIETDYFTSFSKTVTAHSMFGFVTNGTTKTGDFVTLGAASQSHVQFPATYTYYDTIPVTVAWSAGAITENVNLTIEAVAQYVFDKSTFAGLQDNTATIVPLYFGDSTVRDNTGKFENQTIGAVKYAEGYTALTMASLYFSTVETVYLPDSLVSIYRMSVFYSHVKHLYLGNASTITADPYTFHYNDGTVPTTFYYEGKTDAKTLILAGSGNGYTCKVSFSLGETTASGTLSRERLIHATTNPSIWIGDGGSKINMNYQIAQNAQSFCNSNTSDNTTYYTVRVDIVEDIVYTQNDAEHSSWSTSAATYPTGTAW